MWQRFNVIYTGGRPSYGAMTVYNITGICQLHKSAISCDGWPTTQVLLHYNSEQLQYVILSGKKFKLRCRNVRKMDKSWYRRKVNLYSKLYLG